MKSLAYLDTSILVAIALEEPGFEKYTEQLSKFHVFISSNLLESELLSTFSRERISLDLAEDYLKKISILYPTENFNKYLREILEIDYLRGADVFHLATAMWFAGNKRRNLLFATLDEKQHAAARKLRFNVL